MSPAAFSLLWLRRDLRLKDNTALHQALKADTPVQPIFIFDPDILEKLEDKDDARVQFIHETLKSLDIELNEMGGQLWVFHGRPVDIFKELMSSCKIAALYCNHDYEPSAIKRDEAVAQICKTAKIPFESFKDQVIFEKDEVVTDKGTPYTVFGAYKRKWLAQLKPADLAERNCSQLSSKLRHSKDKNSFPSLQDLGFQENKTIQFPERKIKKAILENYDKTRDFPAETGTSHLGLHLRFGTLSSRVLAKAAKELNAIYLSELIWREFFMQILFHFPETVTKPFRKEFEEMPWRTSKADFERWCEGKTGVPIVDAGMRELNATGFMHNRIRMVTASYLTKHLLIPWQKGERYMARKLLDFDLSANVGNWQWVAGSGCDAAPYFRVFNPEIQTKKFDPDLDYIRKWVPEFETDKYPKPIVSHTEGRDRALKAYFSITQKKPIKKA